MPTPDPVAAALARMRAGLPSLREATRSPFDPVRLAESRVGATRLPVRPMEDFAPGVRRPEQDARNYGGGLLDDEWAEIYNPNTRRLFAQEVEAFAADPDAFTTDEVRTQRLRRWRDLYRAAESVDVDPANFAEQALGLTEGSAYDTFSDAVDRSVTGLDASLSALAGRVPGLNEAAAVFNTPVADLLQGRVTGPTAEERALALRARAENPNLAYRAGAESETVDFLGTAAGGVAPSAAALLAPAAAPLIFGAQGLAAGEDQMRDYEETQEREGEDVELWAQAANFTAGAVSDYVMERLGAKYLGDIGSEAARALTRAALTRAPKKVVATALRALLGSAGTEAAEEEATAAVGELARWMYENDYSFRDGLARINEAGLQGAAGGMMLMPVAVGRGRMNRGREDEHNRRHSPADVAVDVVDAGATPALGTTEIRDGSGSMAAVEGPLAEERKRRGVKDALKATAAWTPGPGSILNQGLRVQSVRDLLTDPTPESPEANFAALIPEGTKAEDVPAAIAEVARRAEEAGSPEAADAVRATYAKLLGALAPGDVALGNRRLVAAIAQVRAESAPKTAAATPTAPGTRAPAGGDAVPAPRDVVAPTPGSAMTPPPSGDGASTGDGAPASRRSRRLVPAGPADPATAPWAPAGAAPTAPVDFPTFVPPPVFSEDGEPSAPPSTAGASSTATAPTTATAAELRRAVTTEGRTRLGVDAWESERTPLIATITGGRTERLSDMDEGELDSLLRRLRAMPPREGTPAAEAAAIATDAEAREADTVEPTTGRSPVYEAARETGSITIGGTVYRRAEPLAERAAGAGGVAPAPAAFAPTTERTVFRSGASPVVAETRLALVDVADIEPSHRGQTPNPRHFLPEAQPRERGEGASKATAAQAVVNASALEPSLLLSGGDAYSGPPVVTSRGEAINGTGRVLTVDAYYRMYPDDPKGLREAVIQAAEKAGIDTSAASAMERPMLVRVAETASDDEAIYLGSFGSDGMQAPVTRKENARAIEARADDAAVAAVVDLIGEAEREAGDDEMTLSAAIRRKFEPIKQRLIQAGVLTPATAESVDADDVKAVLLRVLWRGTRPGSQQAFEMHASGAATQGLERAATAMLSLDADDALAPHLEAVAWHIRAMSQAGMDPAAYLMQQSFDAPPAIETMTYEEAVLFALFTGAKKQSEVAQPLFGYARDTRDVEADPLGLAPAIPGLSRVSAFEAMQERVDVRQRLATMVGGPRAEGMASAALAAFVDEQVKEAEAAPAPAPTPAPTPSPDAAAPAPAATDATATPASGDAAPAPAPTPATSPAMTDPVAARVGEAVAAHAARSGARASRPAGLQQALGMPVVPVYRDGNSALVEFSEAPPADPVEYWLVDGRYLVPQPLSAAQYREVDPRVFPGAAGPGIGAEPLVAATVARGASGYVVTAAGRVGEPQATPEPAPQIVEATGTAEAAPRPQAEEDLDAMFGDLAGRMSGTTASMAPAPAEAAPREHPLADGPMRLEGNGDTEGFIERSAFEVLGDFDAPAAPEGARPGSKEWKAWEKARDEAASQRPRIAVDGVRLTLQQAGTAQGTGVVRYFQTVPEAIAWYNWQQRGAVGPEPPTAQPAGAVVRERAAPQPPAAPAPPAAPRGDARGEVELDAMYGDLAGKMLAGGQVTPEVQSPERADDGVSLAGEGEQVLTGQLGFNRDQVLNVLGANMYGSGFVDVTIKELVQNAFDGVKAARARGREVEGVIDVRVDAVERTVEVEDDGAGMTPEVVQSAFFTIGGTNKGDLATGQRSGGFGFAKMAFLISSNTVELSTVRDGVETYVSTTSEQIRSGTFDIVVRPAEPGRRDGTRVKVSVPEQVVDQKGDVRPISFPWSSTSIGVFQHALVGDVEVRYEHTREKPGAGTVETTNDVIPIGRNQKLPPLFTRVTFAWGEADVYVGTERKDPKGWPQATHDILSAGVYQFDGGFKLGNERLPYDVIVDLRPGVPSGDAQYPFKMSREGWSNGVKEDAKALAAYLERMAALREQDRVRASFDTLVSLPGVSEKGTPPRSVKTGSLVPRPRPEVDLAGVGAPADPNEGITITGEGVSDRRSGRVVIPKAAIDDLDQKRYSPGGSDAFKATMKAERSLDAVEGEGFGLGLDPGKPILHNNTTLALASIEGAEALLNEIGAYVHEVVRRITTEIPRYAHAVEEHKLFAGVSLDTNYAGVNVKLDGTFMVFVNGASVSRTAANAAYDAGPSGQEAFAFAALLRHVTLHEATHLLIRNEGAEFTTEFFMLEASANALPGMSQLLMDRAERIYSRNQSAIANLAAAYDAPGVTNLGDSFESNRLADARLGRADGVAGPDGTPQRDGAGVGAGEVSDRRAAPAGARGLAGDAASLAQGEAELRGAADAGGSGDLGGQPGLSAGARADEVRAALDGAVADLMRKSGSALRSGLDPEIMAAATRVALRAIELGYVRFADFVRRVPEQYFAVIRDGLEPAYAAARAYLRRGTEQQRAIAAQMDTDLDVEAMDLDALRAAEPAATPGPAEAPAPEPAPKPAPGSATAPAISILAEVYIGQLRASLADSGGIVARAEGQAADTSLSEARRNAWANRAREERRMAEGLRRRIDATEALAQAGWEPVDANEAGPLRTIAIDIAENVGDAIRYRNGQTTGYVLFDGSGAREGDTYLTFAHDGDDTVWRLPAPESDDADMAAAGDAARDFARRVSPFPESVASAGGVEVEVPRRIADEAQHVVLVAPFRTRYAGSFRFGLGIDTTRVLGDDGVIYPRDGGAYAWRPLTTSERENYAAWAEKGGTGSQAERGQRLASLRRRASDLYRAAVARIASEKTADDERALEAAGWLPVERRPSRDPMFRVLPNLIRGNAAIDVTGPGGEATPYSVVDSTGSGDIPAGEYLVEHTAAGTPVRVWQAAHRDSDALLSAAENFARAGMAAQNEGPGAQSGDATAPLESNTAPEGTGAADTPTDDDTRPDLATDAETLAPAADAPVVDAGAPEEVAGRDDAPGALEGAGDLRGGLREPRGGAGTAADAAGAEDGRPDGDGAAQRGREGAGPRSGDGGVLRDADAGDGRSDAGDGRSDAGDGRSAGAPDAPPVGTLGEQVLGGNHRLSPDAQALAPLTPRARLAANLDALRLLSRLREEGRTTITNDEAATLSRYAGWGGLSAVFDESNAREAAVRAELRALLGEDGYASARATVTTAFFTPPGLPRALFRALAPLLGTGAGRRLLDPSTGIGVFLGYAPEQARLSAVEMDATTAAIAGLLYREAHLQTSPYQEATLPGGAFDVVASNIPFGDLRVFDAALHRQVPGVKKGARPLIHNYFFLKALHHARPGGLIAFVTSTGFLDSATGTDRDLVAAGANLVGAIRLPARYFSAESGTDVVADLVILQKHGDGIEAEPWPALSTLSDVTAATPDDPALAAGGGLSVHGVFAPGQRGVVLGTLGSAVGQFGAQVTVTGDTDPSAVESGLDSALASMLRGVRLPAAQVPPEVSDRRGEEAANPPLPPPPSGSSSARGPRGGGSRGGGSSSGTRGSASRTKGDPGVRIAAEARAFDAANGLPPGRHLRHGSFSVAESGDLMRRADGEDAKVARFVRAGSPGGADRMKGYTALRDAVRDVIAAQVRVMSDDAVAFYQRRLADVYDDFVAAFGPVSDDANANAILSDPDGPLVLTLEVRDEEGRVERSAFFTRRTISQAVQTVPSDLRGALLYSLANRNGIDLGLISQATGQSEDEVRAALLDEGLAYVSPHATETDDEGRPRLLTPDDLSTGNVRAKRAAADAWLAVEEGLDSHIGGEARRHLEATRAALDALVPPDLLPSDIAVRMAAPWVPPDVYAAFMAHLGLLSPSVSYNKATGEFAAEAYARHGDALVAATMTWGTVRRPADELVGDILNNRKVEVWDRFSDGTRELNPQETARARAQAERIQEEFDRWVYADVDRATNLARIYNERFRTHADRRVSGEHLTFPGLSPLFTLRPYQKGAVARILRSSTLLAHVVGAGKTASMIAAAMEARRLGIHRKPLMVVPNHKVADFAAEFLRMYPGANVLAVLEEDISPKTRAALFARIATGDYDAIIIRHADIVKIPVSPATEAITLNERIAELQEVLATMKAGGSLSSAQALSVKKTEAALANLKSKVEELRKRHKKVDVLTFEEMGIDMLLLDEAHEFKNLSFPTRLSDAAGVASTASGKAEDLLVKTRYIHRLNGGDRGVVFATGTPIANSVGEMYVMMTYLMPSTLREANITNFDAWANTFGKVTSEMEWQAGGRGYQTKRRLSRFVNVPELVRIWGASADFVGRDMLDAQGVVRPPIKTGGMQSIVVDVTQEQSDFVDTLGERAERVRTGQVKPYEDNMLVISTDGRKAALSMRLVGSEDERKAAAEDYDLQIEEARLGGETWGPGEHVDPAGAKPGRVADEVFQRWEATKEHRLTQLVFCDYSAPKKDGSYSVYADVRARLVARGVPASEIAFVHDYNTQAEKDALFKRVRSGEVRILMGSTPKMGAGTNVQDRLVAIHHVDAPWRPADVEQRNGRGDRFGNRVADFGAELELVAYTTGETFDAFMWDTLQRKARFIGQVMSGKVDEREIEESDEALSYQEIMALTSGNPLVKERFELEARVKKLDTLRQAHASERFAKIERLRNARHELARARSELAKAEAVAKVIVSVRGVDFKMEMRAEDGTVTETRDRREAALHLIRGAIRAQETLMSQDVGTFGGLRVRIDPNNEAPKRGLGEAAKGAAKRAVDSLFAAVDEAEVVEGLGGGKSGKRDAVAQALATEGAAYKALATLPFIVLSAGQGASIRQVMQGTPMGVITSLTATVEREAGGLDFARRVAESREQTVAALEASQDEAFPQEDDLAEARERLRDVMASLSASAPSPDEVLQQRLDRIARDEDRARRRGDAAAAERAQNARADAQMAYEAAQGRAEKRGQDPSDGTRGGEPVAVSSAWRKDVGKVYVISINRMLPPEMFEKARELAAQSGAYYARWRAVEEATLSETDRASLEALFGEGRTLAGMPGEALPPTGFVVRDQEKGTELLRSLQSLVSEMMESEAAQKRAEEAALRARERSTATFRITEYRNNDGVTKYAVEQDGFVAGDDFFPAKRALANRHGGRFVSYPIRGDHFDRREQADTFAREAASLAFEAARGADEAITPEWYNALSARRADAQGGAAASVDPPAASTSQTGTPQAGTPETGGAPATGDAAGADPDAVALMRGDASPEAGTAQPNERHAQVVAAVERLRAAWPNAPEMRVLATPADLPEDVRESLAANLDEGTDLAGAPVPGLYHRDSGVVYLFSGPMAGRTAEEVVAHEAVGHFGIEALLGEEGMDALADLVWRDARAGALARRLVAAYGLTEPLASASPETRAWARRRLASEVLAHLAQRQQSPGIVGRAVAMIRRALRRIFPSLSYTTAELLGLVAASNAYLEGRLSLDGAAAAALRSRTVRDGARAAADRRRADRMETPIEIADDGTPSWASAQAVSLSRLAPVAQGAADERSAAYIEAVERAAGVVLSDEDAREAVREFEDTRRAEAGLASTEAMPSWYEASIGAVEAAFGEDAPLMLALLAVTSQRAAVDSNMTLALKAYVQILTGQPIEGYMDAVKMAVERIGAGYQAGERSREALMEYANGLKIGAYAAALFGDKDAVAVDQHISEIVFSTDNLYKKTKTDTKTGRQSVTFAPTPAQIAVAKAKVARVAMDLGMDARDVQAALWAINQIRKGQTPRSYEHELQRRLAAVQELRRILDRPEGRDGEDGGQEGPDAPPSPRDPGGDPRVAPDVAPRDGAGVRRRPPADEGARRQDTVGQRSDTVGQRSDAGPGAVSLSRGLDADGLPPDDERDGAWGTGPVPSPEERRAALERFDAGDADASDLDAVLDAAIGDAPGATPAETERARRSIADFVRGDEGWTGTMNRFRRMGLNGMWRQLRGASADLRARADMLAAEDFDDSRRAAKEARSLAGELDEVTHALFHTPGETFEEQGGREPFDRAVHRHRTEFMNMAAGAFDLLDDAVVAASKAPLDGVRVEKVQGEAADELARRVPKQSTGQIGAAARKVTPFLYTVRDERSGRVVGTYLTRAVAERAARRVMVERQALDVLRGTRPPEAAPDVVAEAAEKIRGVLDRLYNYMVERGSIDETAPLKEALKGTMTLKEQMRHRALLTGEGTRADAARYAGALRLSLIGRRMRLEAEAAVEGRDMAATFTDEEARAVAEAAAEALRVGLPVGADATAEVRAAMGRVAATLGVNPGARYTANYLRRMWDRDALARRRRDFLALLKSEITALLDERAEADAKGGEAATREASDADIAEAAEAIYRSIQHGSTFGLDLDGSMSNGTSRVMRGLGVAGSPGSVKVRGLWFIPDSKLEPFLVNDLARLVTLSVSENVSFSEYVRRFGARNERVRALYKALGKWGDKNADAAERLRVALAAARGALDLGSGTVGAGTRYAASVMKGVTAMLTLGMSGVGALAEFAAIPLRQGARASAVGVAKGAAIVARKSVGAGLRGAARVLAAFGALDGVKVRQLREWTHEHARSGVGGMELRELELMGVASHAAMEAMTNERMGSYGQPLSRVQNIFHTFTGLNAITRVQRIMAGAAAIATVERILGTRGALTGSDLREAKRFGLPVEAERRAAMLAWLDDARSRGLDEADRAAPEWAAYTNAVVGLTDQTIVRGSVGTRPGYGSSHHPLKAAAFQLQDYNYAFREGPAAYVLAELRDGGGWERLALLARLLLFFGTTSAVMQLRTFINYGIAADAQTRAVYERYVRKTPAEHVGQALLRGGALGTHARAVDTKTGVDYNGGLGFIASFAGPQAVILGEMAEVMLSSEMTAEQRVRWLTEKVPIAGQIRPLRREMQRSLGVEPKQKKTPAWRK